MHVISLNPSLKTVVLAYCRICASCWGAEAALASVSLCISLAYTSVVPHVASAVIRRIQRDTQAYDCNFVLSGLGLGTPHRRCRFYKTHEIKEKSI